MADSTPGGYHHGNLRAALIETAVALARHQGPDGVLLREVARRTGVSHNAAYRHFSDRAHLLSEVSAVAMDLLEQTIRRHIDALDPTDAVGHAWACLHESGKAYVGFALGEQGLFRTAFESHEWQPSDASGGELGGGYEVLRQVLDRLVEVGAITAERRDGAEVACWAVVHGFAVLHLDDGPMATSPPPERHAALDRALSILEAGLSR